jgi:hypothetical protein
MRIGTVAIPGSGQAYDIEPKSAGPPPAPHRVHRMRRMHRIAK